MRRLLLGYGRVLTAIFLALAVLWAFLLIILPQAAMLERSLSIPQRNLDSSVALGLQNDARTCVASLERHLAFAASAGNTGGATVPSFSAPAPAPGLAVPSFGGAAAEADETPPPPQIPQCARSRTDVPLLSGRDDVAPTLAEAYGMAVLRVDPSAPAETQIELAGQVAEVAAELRVAALAREAVSTNFTLSNYSDFARPIRIPGSVEQRAAADRSPWKKFLRAIGLRFDRDGATFERLGLVTLVRTILSAMAVTALSLLACYPIAFKVALASRGQQAALLLMALVVPYAIVELMRIYAWTTIIDNRGLINSALDWIGAIDLDADGPIQFKRMPITVFVIVVYTYILFMVFPIINVMTTLDRNQLEAARDLGASTWRVHRRIIIPHAKAGIAVGCIATFMLAAGAFSVPRIISSGLQAEWFAQTIYNLFFESDSGNTGAAYSFAYTVLCFVIVALFMAAMRTRLKDFASVRG